jgi:DNA topoisomerase-1
VKAQEAHEAIRPTNILCTPVNGIKAIKDLGPREIKMYELIWSNSLESLMSDALFSSFSSKISAFEENVFTYRSEQVAFPGWLIVANKYERQSKDYAYLMALKQGATIEYKKVDAKQTMKSLKSHHSEAHLVSLLEDNGIGRPSTYAMLIDKIQERNYVKKEDIVGAKVICRDFTLEGEYLTEASTERIIGNEKGKLVIQPLGIIVIEFLEKHFAKLFNYDYTKIMEKGLDQVASGEKVWHSLCGECYQELSILTSLLKDATKVEYKIDETNTYIISKNGPVIKCVENGVTTFKAVKKDIDLTLLENGKYKLEDVVETQSLSKDYNNLGKYKGEDLIVKKGKYGLYAIYGENRLSLSSFGNRPPDNITFKEVFDILEQDGILKPSYCKDQKKLGVLREINASTSVRDGKFGPYVYYKTTQMKTPKFFELKQFEKDTGAKIKTCELNIIKEWIKAKHGV